MKKVIMFKTEDGVIHSDEEAAKKHLERSYGNLLLSLSRKICLLNGSYQKTAEFLDENLSLFRQLESLKEDMIVFDEE